MPSHNTPHVPQLPSSGHSVRVLLNKCRTLGPLVRTRSHTNRCRKANREALQPVEQRYVRREPPPPRPVGRALAGADHCFLSEAAEDEAARYRALHVRAATPTSMCTRILTLLLTCIHMLHVNVHVHSTCECACALYVLWGTTGARRVCEHVGQFGELGGAEEEFLTSPRRGLRREGLP